MHDIGRLIEDHDLLSADTKQLTALVRLAEPSPSRAFDLLHSLANHLHAHLAAEADFIYADEMRKEGSRLDAEIMAFDAEFADLKSEWGTYLSEWSEENIAIDWVGFSEATRWMMRRLQARIDQENAVLYPLALHYGRIRLRAA